MFSWFKNTKDAGTPVQSVFRAFVEDGVTFSATSIDAGVSCLALTSPEVPHLLVQLEDEGFASPLEAGTLLPWESLYRLSNNPHYSSSLIHFELPEQLEVVPALQSHRTLIDEDFAIAVADWYLPTGQRISPVERFGALIRARGELALISEPVWHTVKLISDFHQRPSELRNDSYHRKAWGKIRQQAIAAGARLDGFLFRNVILTPDKLEIGLRRNDVSGHMMVEIAPGFQGAPEDWLAYFDRRPDVPDRYDITTPEGIIQVIVTPEVKTVLKQLKRMPGRRVAGTRAEAFLRNPYAALGEDANNVIDEEQFEQAKEDAGIFFERFSAQIEKDVLGYPIKIGILIESASRGRPESSKCCWFKSDTETCEFIASVREALASELQLCGWEGYDFELLGDTAEQLDILANALEAHKQPRVLVSYANVFDLSNYSARVEEISVEKAYYSPFIAKRNEAEGWFPENIIPMIVWTPEDGAEPIAVPVTEEAKKQLEAKVREAEAAGQDSFTLKGYDKPIPVSEARFILDTFQEVKLDVDSHNFDPEKPKRDTGQKGRKQLVLKANIQSIDYEEARRAVLQDISDKAELPSGLKSSCKLKLHQVDGVKWLQHLYMNSPAHCRGAVLGDDMGLGKTLQLLTLIAWALERDTELPPALIVAPVSLLENWKEEAERFFNDEALPMVTAYGEHLKNLRVSRAAIDEQLKKEGLVKFLQPGWRGSAKIILTTYETLRDLEFSFAAEKWSIMICDEAQKIKNPNSMVTRAAKKQNVTFKIACTGTPVENTLADLWCLFDFIQPGLLGALNDFGRRYRRPIEAETDEEKARVEELREKIAPQILRRLKKDVADLPAKTIQACRIPISSHQRGLYSQAIELFKKRNKPGAVVPFKNHLGLLHYLRQVCTDPRRIGLSGFREEELESYQAKAPKLKWLLETLRGIYAKGEKAIVFCEFREMQRMLRHYIEQVFGFMPDIINGDVSASSSHITSRQKKSRHFRHTPVLTCSFFLP